MGMILVYGWILNRVFFGPVQRVLTARKQAIEEASTLSLTSQDTLKSRLLDYEQAVLEAHRRGTHLKESARNEAYAYRSEVLAGVKADIDREIGGKEAELAASVAEVKAALKAETPSLARLLASRVLGREVAK
jgi:F-type H+-transporting ATPase subunit b